MLLQIFYFALGSALCGAATSLGFLIAGRSKLILDCVDFPCSNSIASAIQGMGVAGIASLSQIIIADLVPLQERGTYNGLVALYVQIPPTLLKYLIVLSLLEHSDLGQRSHRLSPVHSRKRVSGDGSSVSDTLVCIHLTIRVLNPFQDMNLPICGVTAVIAATYLDLKVPRGTFKEKMMSLDWT